MWLAPDQVRVIAIGSEDDPAAAGLIGYARGLADELRRHQVRVETDFSSNPIKAKIAEAERSRVHTMLVVGHRDMEAGAVSVRLHGKGPQGAKPRDAVVSDLLAVIGERRS